MISARTWIAAALDGRLPRPGLAAAAGLAQDPSRPPRTSLEKLLEKLEEERKGRARQGSKDPPRTRKGQEARRGRAQGPGARQAPRRARPGQGHPRPDDKKPCAPGARRPPPPKGDQPKPDDLKGGEKDLDKELERITGKKDKPKNQRDRKDEEETGPLGQVIKEMRDVEERLGQPDTGEETRKKQTEIVKNLDWLIEQMKNAPSQSMAMKMIREGKKPGQPAARPAGQPARGDGQRARPRPSPPTPRSRRCPTTWPSRSGASSPPSSARTWATSSTSSPCPPRTT